MLHMLVNDRKLSHWVASQLLKIRAVVTGINAVGYDIGTIDIILRLGENICTAVNEGFRSSTLFN